MTGWKDLLHRCDNDSEGRFWTEWLQWQEQSRQGQMVLVTRRRYCLKDQCLVEERNSVYCCDDTVNSCVADPVVLCLKIL